MDAAYRPTCVVRLYSLMPCLSGTLKHCRQQSESSSSNTFNSSTLFTTGNDFGLRRSGLGLSSLTSFGASSPSKKSEINFYCQERSGAMTTGSKRTLNRFCSVRDWHVRFTFSISLLVKSH